MRLSATILLLVQAAVAEQSLRGSSARDLVTPVGAFVETNGYLVVEAESELSGPNDWKFSDSEENDLDGFTGSGYIIMGALGGGSGIRNPSASSTISYKLQITNPGSYGFAMRSWKDARSGREDQDNDFWIKLVGGEGDQGVFTKTFMAGALRQWNWYVQQETADHRFPDPVYTFDAPGEYEFQISGRSTGFVVDRFIFYDLSRYAESEIRNLPASRREDSSGAIIPDSFLVNESQIAGDVVRICSGCVQNFVDSAGKVWSADANFVGGRTFSNAGTISGVNAVDAGLYKSERTGGQFSYEVALPTPGVYRLTVALAEIFHNTPGSRIFSIAVENGIPSRLSQIDLVAEVGPFTATQKSILVEVTDGVFNIDFAKVKDNAQVSGLVVEGPIVPSGSPPSPPPPTPAPVVVTAAPVVTPTSSPVAVTIPTEPPVGTLAPTPAATTAAPVAATSAPTPAATVATPTDTEGILRLELIALDDPSLTGTPITNGMVVPAGAYNVEAITSGTMGSVQFGLNAIAAFRTEGVAPYAMCGDIGGNFFACNELPAGATYAITATAYPLGGAGGTPINSVSVSLTIES